MSEYIKREDVYKTLKIVVNVDGCEPSITEIDMDAFEAIPAEDVEPVVRCKDCVKWGKRDCKRNPCAIDISSMDEFCSDGERKAHMERSGSDE